jgi:GNAT superfamily N-acetyltransferase
MLSINRLVELIEDWNFLIRRDGVRSSIHTVGQEISILPYKHQKLLVLSYPLLEPFLYYQSTIALNIRPFVHSDLEIVREIHRPSAAKQCARRLTNGHIGLIALSHGQPAGYAWGCIEVDPNLERVKLTLESGDIYCAYAYTTPRFRRHGVHTALTQERFKIFRDRGYKRAVSVVDINNAPSLSVWQRKFNSLSLGHIDLIRKGPWYQVRYVEEHSV